MHEDDNLNSLDDFVQVFDVPSTRPILDIKVGKIRTMGRLKTLTMCACDSTIYQCVGDSSATLKSTLALFGQNEKLLHENSLSIDGRRKARGDDEETDESDRVKVHFTVNPSQK